MPTKPKSDVQECSLRNIPDDWLVVRIKTDGEEFDAMRQSTKDPWFRVDHPEQIIGLAKMDGLCINIESVIVE